MDHARASCSGTPFPAMNCTMIKSFPWGNAIFLGSGGWAAAGGGQSPEGGKPGRILAMSNANIPFIGEHSRTAWRTPAGKGWGHWVFAVAVAVESSGFITAAVSRFLLGQNPHPVCRKKLVETIKSKVQEDRSVRYNSPHVKVRGIFVDQ